MGKDQVKFYNTDEWKAYAGSGQYSEWSNDVRQEFIRRCVEQHHADQYYDALRLMDVDGPDWEDLTDEQRQNIREENDRYSREMQEFGKMLSESRND